MSVLAFLIASAAAPQSGTPMTLSEAINLANAHSTTVQIAQNDWRAARARVGQQNSKRLPQIGLSGGATEFDNRTTVTLPGSTTPFQISPDHQEQLAIALNEDLDISGQIGASIAQAKLYALSARYGLDVTTEDQALATTSAYYATLRAQQDVRVAAASLEDYRQQFKTTTRLYEGGVGQKIDVDRAQSQVANAESELVRHTNDLDSARSTLNDLLGHPLDQSIELVDPDVTNTTTATEESSPLPSLVSKAMDQRAEALAATVQVAAAKKGIKIAQSSVEPTLSFGLSGSSYPTTSFAYPRSEVGAVSLMVSIPLFDGGLAREKVAEARSLVSTAQAQESQVHRDIALQVQHARLDVVSARKRLDATTIALQAAQAARKLAQQRFESQVALYLEVTDAENALTSADAALVDAKYDLLTAQARLSRALGEPIVH